MSENISEWLENTEGTPKLVEPARVTWEAGPINPATGASHTYRLSGMNLSNNPEAPEGIENEITIYFQNGVVSEVGLNGITAEHLLEILIHRFKQFQEGPFACDENEEALTHMQAAVDAIQKRIADRKGRGVHGPYEK